MKKIKSLIVDDEKLAREDLIAMLGDFQDVEVIGEVSSVDDAIAFLSEKKTDVVFLDIQMPGKTGFELLPNIKKDIRIVFVTAFDEYAIKAFDANAQDYLLKPVGRKRLEETIERLRQQAVKNRPKRPLRADDFCFLMVNSSFKFVKTSEIKRIMAAGNYSQIVCGNGIQGLVLLSLKEWEERLPENIFARIHKNAIINMNYIDRVEEWNNAAYRVFLKDAKEAMIMSRRYAARLKEKLQI